jgi:hypothetical protein
MAKIEKLVIVDVETTGVHGPNTRLDAVVEVAAARVDLRKRVVEAAYSALVRPWAGARDDQLVWPPAQHGPSYGKSHPGPAAWQLGPYHVEGKHFDGVDWSKAVDYERVLDDLTDPRRFDGGFLVDGATLGGQNPPFDREHLQRDCACTGRAWPKLDYHVIDLASIALLPHVSGEVSNGVSLRHMIRWARLDPNYVQQHRALADVRDAVVVLFATLDRWAEVGVYSSLGRRVDEDFARLSPGSHPWGVAT